MGSKINALASGPVGNWLEIFGSHFGGDTKRDLVSDQSQDVELNEGVLSVVHEHRSEK